jgi:hypothetical protein
MANTYIPIASTIVGSGGAATITFSSIPSTYTDLLLTLSPVYTGTGNQTTLWLSQINGSSSNLSNRWLRGSGSAVFSSTDASGGIYLNQVGFADSNTFASMNIYIPNYAGSLTKSIYVDTVQERNATEAYQAFVGGYWANTAAITSLTLDPDGSNTFAQNTTAYLYGISNS